MKSYSLKFLLCSIVFVTSVSFRPLEPITTTNQNAGSTFYSSCLDCSLWANYPGYVDYNLGKNRGTNAALACIGSASIYVEVMNGNYSACYKYGFQLGYNANIGDCQERVGGLITEPGEGDPPDNQQ